MNIRERRSPLPSGLRRTHISEVPSLGHLFEAVPASLHCDRTWWTFGSVTGPAAKARNDPGEPSDRMFGMRVLLLGSLTFETDLQGLEHRQLIRCDNVGGRAIDIAATREHEPTLMFPSTLAPAPIRTLSPILG